MNAQELFSNSICEERMRLAERELCAFFNAVTHLFGPELARASVEDWLEESELIDSPPPSISSDWRSVTVAASVRLASRIDAVRHRKNSLAA
jgi:hypothetical protein